MHLSGPSAPIRLARSCRFELVDGSEDMADTPFASRCLYILHPSN
ncbi:hypothetical protein X748_29230 [Mesorhizobium sp. LNJC386A00]|nr:hypothetical protein X748_29230 [Mesorhizobium sp. LNJC386A00]ESZ75079.1 hypothetical protein X726_19040 [Mesorhizobium sp. L103C105A0]